MSERMQSPAQACPRCGSAQNAGVVAGGLCARCLLKAGVAENKPSSDPNRTTNYRGGFEPPRPGQIASEFPGLEIIELAGRGGMGAVYKARQKNLRRLVALKILPPEIANNPDFASRFERESHALALLNHPNIVQIYDVGKTERFFYFLMEFVDGINLRQAIREGNLAPQEALSIVPQICNALQYAHNQGIVHRDIKPENILLDKDGNVKVTDFGLAKIIDWNQDATLTGTQQVMGTVHYMAPEQVQETRAVDHRADIYSLGVVFYEMLTGQLPLGRFALPSQSRTIDPRLDNVVMRSLENEPDRRYQAVSEFKSDLDTLSQDDHANGNATNPPVNSDHRTTTQSVPQPPIKSLHKEAWEMVQLPAILLQTLGVVGLIVVGLSALLMFATYFWLTPQVRPETVARAGVTRVANQIEPAVDSPQRNFVISQDSQGSSVKIGSGSNVARSSEVTQSSDSGSKQSNVTSVYTEPQVVNDSHGTAAESASSNFALSTTWVMMLLPLLVVFNIIIFLLMIVAGSKMKHLDGYGFVTVACILAIMPINPLLMLFSTFVGIWALIVLNRPQVRQAFTERKRLSA